MRKLIGVIIFCTATAVMGQNIHDFVYVPPPCQGVFLDVPCPSQYADWIEQMYFEGITAGVQQPGEPLAYDPKAPNTREQEAVFILKAEHSILNRIGTGGIVCPEQATNWAKCSGTVYNNSIHPESVVMITYRSRQSDDQIPPLVTDVFAGGFSFEIQTNTTASYLSYTPGDVGRTP